jgi:hypothetical protein
MKRINLLKKIRKRVLLEKTIHSFRLSDILFDILETNSEEFDYYYTAQCLNIPACVYLFSKKTYIKMIDHELKTKNTVIKKNTGVYN